MDWVKYRALLQTDGAACGRRDLGLVFLMNQNSCAAVLAVALVHNGQEAARVEGDPVDVPCRHPCGRSDDGSHAGFPEHVGLIYILIGDSLTNII